MNKNRILDKAQIYKGAIQKALDKYQTKQCSYLRYYEIVCKWAPIINDLYELHSALLDELAKYYNNKIVLGTTELRYRQHEINRTPGKVLYHVFGFLINDDHSPYVDFSKRNPVFLKDDTCKFEITPEEYEKIKPALNFNGQFS